MNIFSKFVFCALVALPSAQVDAETISFDSAVKPFFKEYCVRCHDEKKQKGEFRLDKLSHDFGDELVAQSWSEVMFRINSGEMPPKDEKQPTTTEIGNVADWISARLSEGRAARMSKRNPVTLYRLSRDEYANTVYDLLGVHFDVNAPGAFNEDPRWHGFERIGSLLSLSPSHVDRYFEAAEQIVREAFPERATKPTAGRVEADDSRAKKWKEQNGVTDPARMLLLPGVPSRGTISTRSPGRYRLRIRLSALPSFKGRLPHLSIWDGTVKRSLFGQDVLAPEDHPTVIEIETFLPAGRLNLMNEAPGTFEALTLSLTQQTPFTKTTEKRFTHPSSYKLYNESGAPIFPLLIVDWFEWEGPIVTDADRRKREDMLPTSEDPQVVAASLIRFIERAWRRPATTTDIDRFMAVIKQETDAGEKFHSAYLSALIALMTSKNFYYNLEGTPGQNRPTINDWELAARLSYFLWGSMPDDELFTAARHGTLSRPKVLRTQLNRMLADSKISRFLESFPHQWLQLHRVGMFPPDAELYPDYDPWLEESMQLEPIRFFAEVFRRNLPIREFLSSDWTMLNSRLTMHYSLPRLERPGFEKVNLPANSHRGGLLTQASVLSLTSDGTHHRPVHRGVWVSEAIFGKTPPPPPPNVEPLAPTPAESPKATIRMQLEAHATHAICASCHRKIDPLGFAFDNYDAIGRWRTTEQVAGGQGDNPTVNAAGELADGRQFSGPLEFKHRLLEDTDRFAAALVGQLATYALRRVMTIDDEEEIRAIAAASKQSDYQLRSLIEKLVMSELFQKR